MKKGMSPAARSMSGFQAGQVTQLPLKRVFVNNGSYNQKSNGPGIHGETDAFQLNESIQTPYMIWEFLSSCFCRRLNTMWRENYGL